MVCMIMHLHPYTVVRYDTGMHINGLVQCAS